MTRKRIGIITLILMLVSAYVPRGVVYAAGTDEIKKYAIDILPQSDGSLLDTYGINWCVISNSAGPLTWITVGMPNEQYEIVSSNGDVATVRPDNQGFDYKIRIDLPHEVNAGECVDLSVQVHQYGLAHLDETTNEIGFQFTPGWFNDVPVDHLVVTWHLPSDATQLKSTSPKPTTQNDSQAVWESDLQPGEKFPISVVYDKAAFPDFKPNQTGLPSSTSSNPSESGYSTEVSNNNVETGAPISAAPVLAPMSLSTCLCLCVIAILIFFVLIMLSRVMGSTGRSYHGGGYFGGYPSGGGWMSGGGGGFASGGGGGLSIPNRSGGGSGLFGGRGMSCACVSSGCACACAGGGRAGCSRKGFDVSNLFKDRLEKNIPGINIRG